MESMHPSKRRKAGSVGLDAEPQSTEGYEPPVVLADTARQIIAAAKRLLKTQGYSAVTLAKVAAEAGVNKASVLYHFGNKDGLVTALVDSIVQEELARMGGASPPTATPEECVHTAIQAKTRILSALDEQLAYYEILPHALRDPELRRRVASNYPAFALKNLEGLGLSGDGQEAGMLLSLGRLVSAVVDGLGIQLQLDQDSLTPEGPLEVFEFLLTNSMKDLRNLTRTTS